MIRRLSEQARRLSGSEDVEAATPAARIEMGAAQLPEVIGLIEKLQREAADLRRDEKEYQLDIYLTPINLKH